MQVAANPAPRWHFAGWTGEVSGSEPRQAVVMDAAKSLAAVFARSEPLRPGATKDVTLRTSGRFQLHGGRDGYDVLVPPDATELTVRFRSSSAAESDLYVRRGSEVRSSRPTRWLSMAAASVARPGRTRCSISATTPASTLRITRWTAKDDSRGLRAAQLWTGQANARYGQCQCASGDGPRHRPRLQVHSALVVGDRRVDAPGVLPLDALVGAPNRVQGLAQLAQRLRVELGGEHRGELPKLGPHVRGQAGQDPLGSGCRWPARRGRAVRWPQRTPSHTSRIEDPSE